MTRERNFKGNLISPIRISLHTSLHIAPINLLVALFFLGEIKSEEILLFARDDTAWNVECDETVGSSIS